MGEGKNALHDRSMLVEGLGAALAAPLSIASDGAQIVNPYNDGIERACE